MDELSSADFDIESVLNLFEDIQEELRQEGTELWTPEHHHLYQFHI